MSRSLTADASPLDAAPQGAKRHRTPSGFNPFSKTMGAGYPIQPPLFKE